MTYDEKTYSAKQQEADFKDFVNGLSGRKKLSQDLIDEINKQLKESDQRIDKKA